MKKEEYYEKINEALYQIDDESTLIIIMLFLHKLIEKM